MERKKEREREIDRLVNG